MEHVVIFLLGVTCGAMATSWLFVRKLERQMENNQWLFTAHLLKDGVVNGWTSGIMTIRDTKSATPESITNHVLREAIKLGRDADAACLLVLTRWP